MATQKPVPTHGWLKKGRFMSVFRLAVGVNKCIDVIEFPVSLHVSAGSIVNNLITERYHKERKNIER